MGRIAPFDQADIPGLSTSRSTVRRPVYTGQTITVSALNCDKSIRDESVLHRYFRRFHKPVEHAVGELHDLTMAAGIEGDEVGLGQVR